MIAKWMPLLVSQLEHALGGLNVGDINVKKADRIALEALALGFAAFDVRQMVDAVTLRTAV